MSKLRVLVVDDHADLREVMRLALEHAGFTAEVARDGEDALEAQRRQPADVLITDIFMPGKEGISTIEQFRAEFPQVRIIAVSGGSTAGIRNDYLAVAKQIGADATLRKPFDMDALLDIVRGWAASS